MKLSPSISVHFLKQIKIPNSYLEVGLGLEGDVAAAVVGASRAGVQARQEELVLELIGKLALAGRVRVSDFSSRRDLLWT